MAAGRDPRPGRPDRRSTGRRRGTVRSPRRAAARTTCPRRPGQAGPGSAWPTRCPSLATSPASRPRSRGGRDARRRQEPGTRRVGQLRRVPTARWCRPGPGGPCRCWSLSPARRQGHSPTPAARRRVPSGASCGNRRCHPPPPAPPTAPSSQATAAVASEPSMHRSPDHVHVRCADTSGTRPPVPVGPRRRLDHRSRGGAAPSWATTDVQRSSCLVSWQ